MDEALQKRLLKLLDAEQLSSSKFADAIGVQRSSVSHILTGRNKPSFDFLQKTLRAFPLLNADWLILGEGSMYEDEGMISGGNLFEQPDVKSAVSPAATDTRPEEPPLLPSSDSHKSTSADNLPGIAPSEVENNQEVSSEATFPPSAIRTEGKVVERIVVFYTDKTFDSYDPLA